MNRKPTNLGNYETLEAKKLMTADIGMDSLADEVPTEEVAFYYNKISFGYATTTDGRTFSTSDDMKWDNVKNTSWEEDSSTVEETTEASVDRLFAAAETEGDIVPTDTISLNFEKIYASS